MLSEVKRVLADKCILFTAFILIFITIINPCLAASQDNLHNFGSDNIDVISDYKLELSDTAKNPAIKIDGKPISFDVSPVIIDGRTLVPFRNICESLGIQVIWDKNTQTVIAFKNDTVIKLQIENNVATVNGHQIVLDVPAQIINGRSMVPLRFVSESLGAVVEWNSSINAVDIEFKNIDILNYKLPPYLGAPQLSKAQIDLLADNSNPQTLQCNINTVYDLLQYMISVNYALDEIGEAMVEEGDLVWHHNRTAEDTIKYNAGNCGSTSNMVNYLLKEDYDEVGFIHHTDDKGGHIYNYIMQNKRYYVIDFLQYVIFDDNHSNHIIWELSSLQEWPEYCKEAYGQDRTIRTIVAYTNTENHFPVALEETDRFIGYPKEYDIDILYDAPDDNYSIAFVNSPLRDPVWK